MHNIVFGHFEQLGFYNCSLAAARVVELPTFCVLRMLNKQTSTCLMQHAQQLEQPAAHRGCASVHHAYVKESSCEEEHASQISRKFSVGAYRQTVEQSFSLAKRRQSRL
jgi:hypothetical protein